MRFLILSILLLSSTLINAQTFEELLDRSDKIMRKNQDSSLLLTNMAIDLVREKDTLKWIRGLRLITETYFHHGKSDLQDLVIRLDSVIVLARQIKNYEIVSDILIDLGYYFRYTNDFERAEEYYNESLSLATLHDLTLSIAEANNALGVINYYKGNHIKSLEYYRAAMMEYIKAQDSVKISKSYNNIAIIYKNQRNYNKAIEYYSNSIAVYERIEDKSPGLLRNRYYNLTRAYWETEQYELAEKCILRMIELDKEDHSSKDVYLVSMTILMENYAHQNRIAEALEVARDVERKADSMNIQDFIPFLHLHKGWVFQDAKMYDSALYYYERIEEPLSDRGDEEDLYELFKNKAEVLLAVSKPEEAIKYGNKGLHIALDVGVKAWIVKLYEILYQGHKMAGDHSNALHNFETFHAYKDSLWNEDKSIELGLKQNEIELIQTEAKNRLLESEALLQTQTIQTQRATILGASVIVILLITIALLFRKQLIQRKKLVGKIESQSESLQELNEAKTRFFVNVSHDLRSPLTLILGALDKITEKDYDILDTESRELLDVGYKNGKRLLYLADEIMDLTRLEEGKIKLDLQYVKIVPYLRLLTKMFSSAADIKSIKMEFSAEVDEETILQLDPHQFEKIIYNLLSNAIKFTPEGGEVNLHLKARKKYIEIFVSDSGSGIPEESLNYIFDRYYQAGSNEFQSQAGVGIGLALVKELVVLHKGTIEVRSSQSGTRFHISIPFKESDWVSKAIIPERSLDVVTRNSLWVDLQEEKKQIQVSSLTNQNEDAKSILIVEDHKELRSYLKSILSSDFRIHLAADGVSALDILQSEQIELIISDLMMPYMDGFELIDHLKNDKELRKIPVVVVSARTDKNEKLKLIAKGAEEVISKPFDKEELMLRIKNILDRDWDSNQKLTRLYGETAQEFEKNIMARLERLILKRIDDPHLSVLDLADEMAASERKVYRMIKKISGLTPYELIKEIRWQYLENHLKNNKVKNATEAAQLIGMNNVSSFSEQYDKRFGHSVREMIDS
ncbi:MAG: response regulator [Cyclobacteriaceae bacterium]